MVFVSFLKSWKGSLNLKSWKGSLNLKSWKGSLKLKSWKGSLNLSAKKKKWVIQSEKSNLLKFAKKNPSNSIRNRTTIMHGRTRYFPRVHCHFPRNFERVSLVFGPKDGILAPLTGSELGSPSMQSCRTTAHDWSAAGRQPSAPRVSGASSWINFCDFFCW